MANDSNYIMGIDIGSAKICVSICSIEADQELNLMGVGTSVTAGIKKGLITDTEELLRSLERAVKRAEREAQVRPTRVICNIPSHGMQFVQNVGILLSKEPTGQISESERAECVRRSRNVVKAPDQKIIHAIPISYKVDGTIVQNPVGVFGQTLEVQTHVILAHSETLLLLTQILRDLNLRIGGLAYDLLASSQIYLTEEERRQGVLLLDIGGQFTKAGLFRHGVLQHSTVLPIGGDTFTQDLSACLKIAHPEAERLKILYGDLSLSRVDPAETIEITTKDNGRKTIKKQLVCQILEARAQEVIKLLDPQFSDLNATDAVVLGGAGALLKGFGELLQRDIPNAVREGLPDPVQSIIESSSYSASIGLVLYALRTRAITFTEYSVSPIKKVQQWVKEFF